MKALLITAAFPPMQVAGEADHAFHLCRHLAEAGLDIHVITTQGNVAVNHPAITVYPVIATWRWSDLPLLLRYTRRCAPSAILLMYSSGPHYNYHPMITFLPTLVKRLLPGVRFVTQFENVTTPRWKSFPGRVVRKGLSPWVDPYGMLLRSSDCLIVLSEHQRMTLAKHALSIDTKSVLIPPPPIMRLSQDENGGSRQRGRKALGVEPDDFLLTYFGHVYQGKGLETLFKALQMVGRRRSHVRLVIVGGTIELPPRPSYGQEMRALSKQLGLDNRVIWTGEYAWDSDEASVYLRAADVGILPFDRGVRLNNSSFAAMAAHGLPIITTHGAWVESPFVHGKNVFLCPPQNPEDLCTAIETLIDTPNLRQHLRLGALTLAHEWFSWESTIKRTIATFS